MRLDPGHLGIRLVFGVVLALAARPLSAGAVSPKTSEGIGVARFEQAAPSGIEVPDVAGMLADRLRAHGLDPVVGPDELGAPALADPTRAELQEWGARSRVAAIVTGRATRLGSRTSIDLRLRATRNGEPIATFVEEAPQPDALESAVDRIAARIAAASGPELHVASAPPPSQADPQAVAPAAEPDEAREASAPQGVPLRSDAPISIASRELEVLQDAGRRRLLFTGDVRVSQEDVTLRADRLEAFYPAGESQPDRLVASGGVQVAQGEPERSMRCDEATYFRQDQRVLCGGNAELRQGSDRVRGEQIEIFLDSGRLRVTGGAVVNFRPRDDASHQAVQP